MKATRIHFQWAPETSLARFRTGVSLHSHTLHSRESLDFIYRAAQHSTLLRLILRRGEARYRAYYGADLDLRRGWWTPPLAPVDAYNVEVDHVRSLGLAPLVSLTDHDDIEAPMTLQAVNAARRIPVSVEWTVPFRATFFHLGIHNLPPLRARSTMSRLAEYTANPREHALKETLAGLHANPGTLIVFNHPLWDEMGVGGEVHRHAALEFLAQCGEYVHAIEVNGLRPWSENRQAMLLARAWSKPVISGGDRHALEPNTTLNLTNAADFAEFASEVRGGQSDVLITPPYRQRHAVRIFHNLLDVFRTYPNHGFGWTEWSDRVFYCLPDGTVTSLSQIWGGRPPQAIGIFSNVIRFAGQPPVRQALRSAVSRSQQVVL